MPRPTHFRRAVTATILALALSACGETQARYRAMSDEATAQRPIEHLHATVLTPTTTRTPPLPSTDLFVGVTRLSWEMLFQRLHTANRTLAARIATWQAAVARYPQASALDDPTLSYWLAPRSLGDGHEPGEIITLTQPLPWPGKRSAKGEAALANADASRAAITAEHRHHLIESRAMFAEYWLAYRKLALYVEARRLIVALHDSAAAGAAAGGDSLAALDATLALAEIDREVLTAEREKVEKSSLLNALLGRAADAALPPPIEEFPDPQPLPDAEAAKSWSHTLPGVVSAQARIAEAEAMVRRAERDSYPDLAVSGSYSSMEEHDNRLSVGVSIILPIYRERREAARDEAEALLRARRAEVAQALADSEQEVIEARARLDEGAKALALLRVQALPAARQAAATARAGYASGTGSLAAALNAERMLVTLRLREVEELHEYFHRLGYLMDIPPLAESTP